MRRSRIDRAQAAAERGLARAPTIPSVSFSFTLIDNRQRLHHAGRRPEVH
jgi:hypothetical protein